MRLSVTLLAARPMKSHRCDDGDDDDDAALDACAFAKGTKKKPDFRPVPADGKTGETTEVSENDGPDSVTRSGSALRSRGGSARLRVTWFLSAHRYTAPR